MNYWVLVFCIDICGTSSSQSSPFQSPQMQYFVVFSSSSSSMPAFSVAIELKVIFLDGDVVVRAALYEAWLGLCSNQLIHWPMIHSRILSHFICLAIKLFPAMQFYIHFMDISSSLFLSFVSEKKREEDSSDAHNAYVDGNWVYHVIHNTFGVVDETPQYVERRCVCLRSMCSMSSMS